MERMNYTPDELREAFRYLREQGGIHLCNSHAANWRSKFTLFIEAMMKNQEALRLLVRLLDGHQRVSATAWYKAAADAKAPPLPTDRYERLALGWQLVAKAMPKSNPDGFDKNEKVDLPYVLVNSDLQGASFGERFYEFRLRYLEPFIREFETTTDDILAAIPKGAGSVDLWDAALAAFQKPSTAEAPPPGALARAIAAEEAAARAKAEGRPDPGAASAKASAPSGAAEASESDAAPVAVEEGLPAPRARKSRRVDGGAAERPARKAKAARSEPPAKAAKPGKPKAGKAAKGKAAASKEPAAPAEEPDDAGDAAPAGAPPAPKRRAPEPEPEAAPPPAPAAAEPEPAYDDTTRIRDVAQRAREKARRARRHPG